MDRGPVLRFASIPAPGKGSHGRFWYGARATTMKDRRKKIRKGLLRAMLRELGLTFDDIS